MSSLAKRLSAAAGRRAPFLATAAWTYAQLRRQARGSRRAARTDRDVAELARTDESGTLVEIPDLYDVQLHAGPLQASQKREELLGLLERVGALEPRRVCEIGTSTGGTLYLLTRVSHPQALLISVDLLIPPHAEAARRRMVRPGQRLVSVEADSQLPETRAQVEELLRGEQLDVLFIDGDHSYEGVRRDFELYSPLVRTGGLVALHDINEDFGTRHGMRTPAISGDVPLFWRELEAVHRTEELIADPEQDGYGIGVVYLDRTRSTTRPGSSSSARRA